MKFAISPCPNDIFSFKALIDKDISSDFEFEFEDIETLNTNALKQKYPLTKLSFSAYLANEDNYELLNVGAALGIGTGPILVSKDGVWKDDLKRVLIPGRQTTACLLLNYYMKKNKKGIDELVELNFREILEKIDDESLGVLIHEGRFVFEDYNLKLVADLGDFWTSQTNLPVPLGCICLHKNYISQKDEIEAKLMKSIQYAFDNPQKTKKLVKSYAQYLEDDVIEKHIYAFVNEYSLDISNIKTALIDNLKNAL